MNFLKILFAIAFATTAAQAKLNIVVTTPDLAAVTKEVTGNLASITTLARPTEDPHFVDAKPSFIVKLSRADALIEGGAELEIGWLPPLIEGSRNSKLEPGAPGHIACNQGIQLLEVPATLDRAKGDIHAAGNPHFMIDPVNAGIVAEHIASSLGALDPKNSAKYQSTAQHFKSVLDSKLVEWQKKLAPFKGEHVVTYHDSWPYFSQRFGILIDVFLEPKPGIPPTPAHLAEVIEKIKTDKIRVIFVEAYLNRKTAENVAAQTGATVLDVSQFPGALKGTDENYVALLDNVIDSLAKALAAK
jgi:zinc/manganese transport system substrate-binding protein